MQGVGSRQHDGLDPLVGKGALQIVAQGEAMSLGQGQGGIEFLADAMDEAELPAPALHALDDVLAPPAKADDGGVDHI